MAGRARGACGCAGVRRVGGGGGVGGNARGVLQRRGGALRRMAGWWSCLAEWARGLRIGRPGRGVLRSGWATRAPMGRAGDDASRPCTPDEAIAWRGAPRCKRRALPPARAGDCRALGNGGRPAGAPVRARFRAGGCVSECNSRTQRARDVFRSNGGALPFVEGAGCKPRVV